jgi:PleD family two-component response regulator
VSLLITYPRVWHSLWNSTTFKGKRPLGGKLRWLPVFFFPCRQRTRSAERLEGHVRGAIASAFGKLRKQPERRPVSDPVKPRAVSGEAAHTFIPILVASQREEDHRRVRESLEKGQWLIVDARDFRAALSLTQCVVFPVIVCDRDFLEQDGHSAVRSLAGGWRTASLIWLTDQLDSGLWENLLEQGGFDVLMRPLNEDDFLAVLDSAYRQWADGRPSHAVSIEPSRSTPARSRAAS